MNARFQAPCALNISDETLSALRDDLLSPDESNRIQAHAATCASCRDRLGGFQRIGAALTGQRLTAPSARLWDDVQMAVAASGHDGRWRRHSPASSKIASRPQWTGLSALAAALLVALLFGLLLHSALADRSGVSSVKPTATPSNAETPVADVRPTWQRYDFPVDILLFDPGSAHFNIAPSDGNTAYICDPIYGDGGAGEARIFVTHDRGAHWAELGLVTVGSSCGIEIIDTIDPNDLLVVGSDNTLRSTDGGLTWTHLPTSTDVDTIQQFASFDSKVYAITTAYSAQISGNRYHLAVSVDGMRSWQNIDAGLGNGFATSFWINSATGDLLAKSTTSFWQSHDGGAHWTFIPLPTYVPDQFVVVATGPNAWRICNLSICTMDGGATWTPVAALSPSAGLNNLSLLALTPNGALLVIAGKTDPDTRQPVSQMLYELPANATHWSDLGLAPEPDGYLTYRSSPDGGTLWNFVPDRTAANGLSLSYDTASLPSGK